MPVNTDKTNQTGIVTNEPSKLQNEAWGGLWGAAAGTIWPGGNFGLAPQYQGQMNAPQGQQTTNWYNNVNNLQNPNYSGVMDSNSQLANQAYNRMQGVGDIGINANYQNQQFQVNPNTFQDPLAGYTGGNYLSVNAPSVLGTDYNTAFERVSAPQGVQAERIGGIPQISAPNLQYFQAQGPERVNAANLKDFQMQAAANIAPQSQVGTEDWRSADTASSFMSPYMQNVVDTQKLRAQQDYDQQLTGVRSQAAKAGAFGGSRQAVEESTMNRDLQDRMAQIQATGTQQAYQAGQQQFNQQQQLGLQGQQFNVQSGLQAALANQANQQQANVQNLSSYLQTQGLGAQTGLQAQGMNQNAGLQTNLANLQANQATQALGSGQNMQGQMANQQMAYNQQAQNAANAMQAGIFNNTQNMQGQMANQQAGLQTGMLATNLGYQAGLANAGFNMQGQLANQQAQQAQQGRNLAGLQSSGGWGSQAGLQGQQLGMTAQQLGMQSNQFGAGLDLQAQTAQQQARQAAQASNLNYMQMGANMNQANAGLMTQGFNNAATGINLQQNAATNQQGVDQANANRSYQDWLRQIAYPMQQIQFGANIASQFPAQGTTQTAQQGVKYMYTPDPSLYNQVMGGIGTFVGAAAGAAGFAGGGLMEEPEAGYGHGGLIRASDIDSLAGLAGHVVGSFLGEGEEE